MKYSFLAMFWLLLVVNAKANDPRHSLTAEEAAYAKRQNEWARKHPAPFDGIPKRPYAEYETAQYVLFSYNTTYGSGPIREAIAKNLPEGLHLVVMVRNLQEEKAALTQFSKYLPKGHLHTVITPHGDTFWARDTSPEPVFADSSNTPVNLVETRHREGEKIAPHLTKYLKVPLVNSKYHYPGGNFLADSNGNCFSVETPVSEADMQTLYGCKQTIRFPFVHGIGHVDETLKILSNSVAFTDVPQYKTTLEKLGYTVHLLPRPSNSKMGTYANSLLVNGTVFLPIYGAKEDSLAIKMYESQNLKVYPLRSNELSDKGLGSIHCITMSYPPIEQSQLLSSLDYSPLGGLFK